MPHMPPADAQPSEPSPSPPRAFTQGLGTVFQFVGGIQFLVLMFVCCASGLISKNQFDRDAMTKIGWHLPGDPADRPTYTGQRALTISLTVGVVLGLGIASIGLGLQAESRRAPLMGIFCTGFATLFWLVHTVFAVYPLRSAILILAGLVLTIASGILFVLAIGSRREMLRDPPPSGLELLPADYQTPYSHLHQDSPEVRLAAELEQRRRNLAVQQKELEALEKRLKRRLKESGDISGSDKENT